MLPLLLGDTAAAYRTWDGGDVVNNNWTDAHNWASDIAPVANDLLVFPAGVTDVVMNNDFAAGTDFSGVTFTGTGYVVNGNAFDLLTAGVNMNVVGVGTATLNPALTLVAAQPWNIATFDDTLTVEGLVNLNGNALTFTGSGVTVINGGLTGGTGSNLGVNLSAGASGGVRLGAGGGFAYGGTTTVQEGVLEVNGLISTSQVTVAAGGVLGGTGTTNRVTSTGGVIQPGRVAGGTTDNPANLVIGNNLACDAASTLILNLAGPGAGTTYDQLDVTGTVNLGGADLIVRLASGYRPLGTPSFTLINNDGTDAVTGTFNGLADGAKVTDEAGAVNFIIDYHGGTGNDVVIIVVKVNATGVTSVWDGGDATNTNWTDSDNWNPNGVPVAGNSLTFPAGLAAADRLMNNNFANGTSFHTLTFADSGYQVSGNQLVPTGGITATPGTGTTTFSNLVSPFVSQTFSAANGGDLVFDGNVSMGSASPTLTLAADHGSSVVYVNGDLAGTSPNAAVVIDGPGDVYFNGAKSFTAPLTINEGASLDIDHAAGLGSPATDSLVDGVLMINNAAGLTLAEDLRIAGTVSNQAGANSLTGSITLRGTNPLDQTGAFRVHGGSLTAATAIGGSGMLQVSGPGDFTLAGSAPNTWEGGTLIYDGVTLLQKPDGVCALPANAITIGNGFVPGAEIRLLNSNQIDDTARVIIALDGVLNLNGKKETVANLALEGPGTAQLGTGGELMLTGGLVTTASASPAMLSGGTVIAGPGVTTWYVADGAAEEDLVVGSDIDNLYLAPGYIVKTGAGLMTLAGRNVRLMPLSIESGTVRVTGDCRGLDVFLEGATAVLEGSGEGTTGWIYGSTGGGTIAPGGAGVGSFECWGLELNAATTLQVDLLNPVTGTGYDQLRVYEHFQVGGVYPGGATLAVTVLGGFSAGPGDRFVIIDNRDVGPAGGTFAGLPEGAIFTAGGKAFSISYAGGHNGNDVVLTYLIAPSGVTKMWSGAGANANWSTAANWLGGVAPAVGDSLAFPAGALQKSNTNNFADGTTFHSITLAASGYLLTGNQIWLNAGIAATHGVTASSTVAFPFRTIVSQAVTANGGLTLTGAIDGNARVLTFAKTGAGNLVVNGVISGDGGLEKTGSGSLFLNAPNTYAGTTRIREGIVDIQTDTSLGGHGSTWVDAAGTLVLSSNLSINVGDESLVLYGTLQASGTAPFHSWDGPMGGYEAASVIHCEVPLTLSGRWPNGHFTKTGSATLRLSGGAYTNSGDGLTVNEGMVELALAATVSLKGPIIVGDGNGTDTLRLINSDQIWDYAAVTLIGGVLDLNGQSETIASLTSTGGTVLQSGLPYLVVRESLTTLASAAPTTL
ncbi:MAG: autotransporter-associated beta strand repeat-containing protein, partial [Verrucomicrobia bacterium]|nr:autotransporter-associated beta strand repeat-containing protein [Verrucomicrobiota bacterium]